jgi:hypothetical protein
MARKRTARRCACGKRLYRKHSDSQPRHEGTCRACWRKKNPKVRHYCIEPNCGREVTGPGRRCNPCNAARMRAAKAKKGSGVPASKSTTVAAPPDRSWWIGTDAEFAANYRDRLPRFLAAGIVKDRPAIGMSLTTY